jgi:hypothetical protein
VYCRAAVTTTNSCLPQVSVCAWHDAHWYLTLATAMLLLLLLYDWIIYYYCTDRIYQDDLDAASIGDFLSEPDYDGGDYWKAIRLQYVRYVYLFMYLVSVLCVNSTLDGRLYGHSACMHAEFSNCTAVSHQSLSTQYFGIKHVLECNDCAVQYNWDWYALTVSKPAHDQQCTSTH